MLMTRQEYQGLYQHGRTDLWLHDHLWDDPNFLKLNLGCGEKPFSEEGWVNLDYYSTEPDVMKHDLTVLPWPFIDNSFDYALAMHILEHIPHNVPRYAGDFLHYMLRELARVMKPNSLVEVHVPSSRNPHTLEHMGHVRHVGWRTFETLILGECLSSSEVARTLEVFRLKPVEGAFKRWHGMKVGKITDYHARKYLGLVGETVSRLIGHPETERFVFRVIK